MSTHNVRRELRKFTSYPLSSGAMLDVENPLTLELKVPTVILSLP